MHPVLNNVLKFDIIIMLIVYTLEFYEDDF